MRFTHIRPSTAPTSGNWCEAYVGGNRNTLERLSQMKSLESLRRALAKRAAYHRTVREIRALPVELAIEDMGIDPYNARRIAHTAVYGA